MFAKLRNIKVALSISPEEADNIVVPGPCGCTATIAEWRRGYTCKHGTTGG